MTLPLLEFWFDYASTYSYLSALRIEALAGDAGVRLAWRPFLLGPLFRAQGWETSPFVVYPAKGRYMWRDVARRARRYGLPFARPAVFPAHSLQAARIGLVAEGGGWCGAFSRATFHRQFADGADIGTAEVLREIVAGLGRDADAVLAQAGSAPIKEALREQTARAQALGIFGAPSFVVAGELFWGDDRLEDALAWAGDPTPHRTP